jgi:hypothetical protein
MAERCHTEPEVAGVVLVRQSFSGDFLYLQNYSSNINLTLKEGAPQS